MSDTGVLYRKLMNDDGLTSLDVAKSAILKGSRKMFQRATSIVGSGSITDNLELLSSMIDKYLEGDLKDMFKEVLGNYEYILNNNYEDEGDYRMERMEYLEATRGPDWRDNDYDDCYSRMPWEPHPYAGQAGDHNNY